MIYYECPECGQRITEYQMLYTGHDYVCAICKTDVLEFKWGYYETANGSPTEYTSA